jgi:hypothetical protein
MNSRRQEVTAVLLDPTAQVSDPPTKATLQWEAARSFSRVEKI